MKPKFTTSQLAKAGLFIAMSIIFTRLFSFRVTPVLRIGFGQLPIILAGIVINPFVGFAVGAIADLVGFMMNSMGGMFIPGLTLSAGLTGLIPGLIYKYVFKKNPKFGIYIGVILNGLLINALLNTYWLSLAIGGYSFIAAFPMRFVNQLIMIPLNIIMVLSLLKLPIFKNHSSK